jgi:hypothetical protein
VGEGEGVAHGVQQVHPVVDAEPVQALDRRADRDCAGAHDQLVVVEPGGHAVPAAARDATAGDVDHGGDGVQA